MASFRTSTFSRGAGVSALLEIPLPWPFFSCSCDIRRDLKRRREDLSENKRSSLERTLNGAWRLPMLGQFLASLSVLSSCAGVWGVAALRRETQWKRGFRNL